MLVRVVDEGLYFISFFSLFILFLFFILLYLGLGFKHNVTVTLSQTVTKKRCDT